VGVKDVDMKYFIYFFLFGVGFFFVGLIANAEEATSTPDSFLTEATSTLSSVFDFDISTSTEMVATTTPVKAVLRKSFFDKGRSIFQSAFQADDIRLLIL